MNNLYYDTITDKERGVGKEGVDVRKIRFGEGKDPWLLTSVWETVSGFSVKNTYTPTDHSLWRRCRQNEKSRLRTVKQRWKDTILSGH